MTDTTPEQQAIQLFVDMLPNVLGPVIAQRQAIIRDLDERISQKTAVDRALDQSIESKRREYEELGNAYAQRGAQLLRITDKYRKLILGPDEPFDQKKVDTFEHALDERLTAQQVQP
jgi:hypothetical protein